MVGTPTYKNTYPARVSPPAVPTVSPVEHIPRPRPANVNAPPPANLPHAPTPYRDSRPRRPRRIPRTLPGAAAALIPWLLPWEVFNAGITPEPVPTKPPSWINNPFWYEVPGRVISDATNDGEFKLAFSRHATTQTSFLYKNLVSEQEYYGTYYGPDEFGKHNYYPTEIFPPGDLELPTPAAAPAPAPIPGWNMPGVWVFPTPSTHPRPRVRPRRNPNQNWQHSPGTGAAFEVVPGGRPYAIPVPTGRPPPGTREVKVRNPISNALAVALNAGSELIELIEIIADNSGVSTDQPYYKVVEELFFEGKIADLNVRDFLIDFAANEVEDRVVAAVNGAVQGSMKDLGFTTYQIP